MITFGDARDAACDVMFDERGGVTGWPGVEVHLPSGPTIWDETFTTAPVGWVGKVNELPASLVWVAGEIRLAVNPPTTDQTRFTSPVIPVAEASSAWAEVAGQGVWWVTLYRYSDAAGTVELENFTSEFIILGTGTGKVSVVAPPPGAEVRAVRLEVGSGALAPATVQRVTRVGIGITSIEVQSVTVRRELAGDLPAEASLLSGGVSTSVDIATDLRSQGPHPAILTHRQEWPGQPVTVRAGYDGYTDPVTGGPLRVPVFDGVLRSIGFDEATNARPITLMDRSDQMRAPVFIPQFGSYADAAHPKKTNYFPTNLTAVIVAACHASGIRITPPPSNGAVWSAPLVAGMLSDIGWAVPAGGYPNGAWHVPGRFGRVPRRQTSGTSWLTAYPSAPWNGATTVQFEFWVDPANLPVGTVAWIQFSDAAYGIMQIHHYGAGIMQVGLYNGSTTSTMVSLSADPATGWHHVAARVQMGASSVIAMAIDGGARSSATLSIDTRHSSARARSLLNAQVILGAIQQASLHTKTETGAAGWLGPEIMNFTPQADLDFASLEVSTIPAVDGVVSWDLCKQIAQAELGMVGFSEEGRFYFKNRASLNTGAPVATWGTDLVANIAGTAAIDSVRDQVTATVRKTWHLNKTGAAYIHGEVLSFPVGTTEVEVATAKPLLLAHSSVMIPTTSGAVGSVSSMALTLLSSGASPYTGNAVYATVHAVSSTTFRLVVVNNSPSTLHSAWPTTWAAGAHNLSGGAGSLVLVGRMVDDDLTTAQWSITSGTGSRTIQLPENVWRQDPLTTKSLANSLRSSLATPRLQLADITVPADLRLQIGDVVRLTDHAGRIPDISARVVRLTRTIGGRVPLGMQQTVSLRSLS